MPLPVTPVWTRDHAHGLVEVHREADGLRDPAGDRCPAERQSHPTSESSEPTRGRMSAAAEGVQRLAGRSGRGRGAVPPDDVESDGRGGHGQPPASVAARAAHPAAASAPVFTSRRSVELGESSTEPAAARNSSRSRRVSWRYSSLLRPVRRQNSASSRAAPRAARLFPPSPRRPFRRVGEVFDVLAFIVMLEDRVVSVDVGNALAALHHEEQRSAEHRRVLVRAR
jgi:hypothetical protein